jgi:hypothetical protein
MNTQEKNLEEQSSALKNKEVNNDNNYIDYEVYDCEPEQPDLCELFDEMDYEQYLEEQRHREFEASLNYLLYLERMNIGAFQAEEVLRKLATAIIGEIGELHYQHIVVLFSQNALQLNQLLEEARKDFESINV